MRDNILENKEIVFHGIGTDILRFISVMEHGIVSRNKAVQKNISINVNFGIFNGEDYISVALSPSITNTDGLSGFSAYIKKGISFIIKNSEYIVPPKESEMHSGFIDEALIKDSIDMSDIIGIMIPADILDKKLNEIPFGLSQISNMNIDKNCYNAINQLFEKFGYANDITQLENLFRERKLIKNDESFSEWTQKNSEIKEKIDSFMRNYIQKCLSIFLDKSDITLRDVITYYNYQNLTIYDTNGQELINRNIENENEKRI